MSRQYQILKTHIKPGTQRQGMSAFTLIELIIVVTIISILASISIIGATSIQRSTRDDARKSQATIVAEALEKYYDDKNEYPSVASITNKPVDTVKQKLAISDTSVLTFPTVTAGTSALVASNPTPARLTYVASTVDTNPAVVMQCQTNDDGYCDAFALQYVKESDNGTVTINSRHNSVNVLTDPNDPVVLSPPTQPAVVGSQVNSSLVRFTASSAVCSVGSVEYKIRYNTTSSSTSSMPDWSTVTWGAATTKDINPGANTRFYSQSLARCVSGSENSADSAPSAVDTLDFTPAPPPGTPPSLSAISASALSTSQIAVNWSAASGSAPITYTLRYGTSSGSYGSTAAGCSAISTTSCTLNGLAANTTYYFQLTATNSFGSAVITVATATSAAEVCSAVPSGPAPSASATSTTAIQVSWSASSTPANCSAPTYTVQYGTTNGSYGSTACSSITATSCTISGLTSYVLYYIRVTPTNAYGSGTGGLTSARTKPILSINTTDITNYGVLRTNFNYNGTIGQVSASPGCNSIETVQAGTRYVCVTPLGGATCSSNRTVTLSGEVNTSASATANGVNAPTSAPPNLSFPNKYANGFQATWSTLPAATYYQMEVWQGGALVRYVEDTQPPATVSSLSPGSYNFRTAGANCAGRGPQSTSQVSFP